MESTLSGYQQFSSQESARAVRCTRSRELSCLLFRRSSLGQFQSPIVRIPAVQVCSVRIANRNHPLWHDPAETARPPLNQQESAGDTGEVLCGASLNRVKISEDEDLRPTEHCRASYASPPSLTLRPIIRSQTSRVLTGVFPSKSLASAKH